MDLKRAIWPHRVEPWLFGALVLLHAVPVLAFPWFPTLDGPVHLYNARIIGSLLRCEPATAHFFELNPFPEPNWLGHAIMAAVMSLSSAQMAEKVVMLLYVLGLPLAFRFATRRSGGDNGWASVLIFPFIYGFTFRIGFVNFSLGLPLLLLSIGVGARSLKRPSRRSFFLLAGLLLALYFAHLTCFLIAILSFAILAYQHTRTSEGAWLPGFMKGVKPLLFAALPGLVLTTAFFLAHQDTRAEPQRLPMDELLQDLLTGRPFVALGPAEKTGARVITWAMMALTMLVLFTAHRTKRSPLRGTWAILLLIATMAAYFLVPDQMATGGFITVRMLLFVYLFWALWLALQASQRWLGASLLMIVTGTQLYQLHIHYDYTKGLNVELAELLAVTDDVPKDASLVSLNYSGNWLHSNFPCYLGAIRGANVLDNFGARTAHMPVRWRGGQDPGEGVGSFATTDRPCVHFEGAPVVVDIVLTWRLNDAIVDSCTQDVRAQLGSGFEQTAFSPTGDARLFRRRSP